MRTGWSEQWLTSDGTDATGDSCMGSRRRLDVRGIVRGRSLGSSTTLAACSDTIELLLGRRLAELGLAVISVCFNWEMKDLQRTMIDGDLAGVLISLRYMSFMPSLASGFFSSC